MGETVGALGRVAFDTATPFDASSVWLEFDSETITKTKEILYSNGIRGTRTRPSGQAGIGPTRVSGTISGVMTRVALDTLLPFALGTAESANVFAVAETLPDGYMLVDKGTDTFLVSEFKVATLTIDFSGPLVRWSMTIEAEEMTGGQSWPGTLTQPDTSKPYVMTDLGNVTVAATARKNFGGSITIDNALTADQWGNSLTRDELIVPNERIVTVTSTFSGDTANSDLLDHVGSVGVDGEQIQYVFTNANEASSVVTITLGRVVFPPQQPTTTGKNARRFDLTGEARGYLHPGTGSHVPDISVTNAHA